MPAAVSNNKTENGKVVSNTNIETSGSELPIRQAIVILEHKIRNLEKRKTKLESYRAIQFSGKELSNDQKTAVAKFNEVAQSLELARDFFKQLVGLSSSYDKEQKKQQRRDAVLKSQQETSKIREVLIVQKILNSFSDEATIKDFTLGENGAVKLEAHDIEIILNFSKDVDINECNFSDEGDKENEHIKRKAEYLSMTIDGRNKAYSDEFTFESLKKLFERIWTCGYFSGNNVPIKDEIQSTITSEIFDDNNIEDDKINVSSKNFDCEAPSAETVPVPMFEVREENVPRIIEEENNFQYNEENGILDLKKGVTNPTFMPPTLHSSSHEFTPEQQFIQMRPLSEVLGVGNFFFLQDSEIDTPEIVGELPKCETLTPNITTIQSQIFTNQSMVSEKDSNHKNVACNGISFQQQNVSEIVETNSNPQNMTCIDAPNPENLPMPGFPELNESKNMVKSIDSEADILKKIPVNPENSSNQWNNNWKYQNNSENNMKWNSNNENNTNNGPRYSDNRNRNFSSNKFNNERNSGRFHGRHQSAMKSNGQNYFKNNENYFQGSGQQTSFKPRNQANGDKSNRQGSIYSSGRSQK